MSQGRIEDLLRALEADPGNLTVRSLAAELLADEERHGEACQHYSYLLDHDGLDGPAALRAGRSAVRAGNLQLAARCLELAGGEQPNAAELREELEAALVDEGGLLRPAQGESAEGPPLEPEDRNLSFADVGGLEGVKEAVRRTIVLPFQRPELYIKYGRRAGGGVLLYGPPGCGKTMIARATAGECGLPFLNLRIEDVLDPYFGGSEQRLHAAFDQARSAAPCVLFVDELDAIAFPRRKHQGGMGRSLVDQLLQELDSIGSDNDNLLVLAATNAPWDVDDALKRPGRFDRLLFVPPPDRPAREAILTNLIEERPHSSIDVPSLAAATGLFSGADIAAVVETAVDEVIEHAMRTGTEVPIEQRHLEGAVRKHQPTTLDWLGTARNFVEFSNSSGRYDAISEFLRTDEAKAGRGPSRRWS